MSEAWREEARLVREGKKAPGPSAPELARALVLGQKDHTLSVAHIQRGRGGPSFFIVGSPRRPRLIAQRWDDVVAYASGKGLEAPPDPPRAAVGDLRLGDLVFGVRGPVTMGKHGPIKRADTYVVGELDAPRVVSHSWEAIRQCLWGWVATTTGGRAAASDLHARRFERRPKIFWLAGSPRRIHGWGITSGWTVVLFLAERLGPTIESLSEEPSPMVRVVLDAADRVLDCQPLERHGAKPTEDLPSPKAADAPSPKEPPPQEPPTQRADDAPSPANGTATQLSIF